MKMEDFMIRANTLKGFLNTDSGTFLKMGIAVNCLDAATGRRARIQMSMDEKYQEIDAVSAQCSELITKYEQVSAVISGEGSLKAGEKAKIENRIKENDRKCGDIRGKLESLVKETAFFIRKKEDYERNTDRLKAKAREIEARKKSGNNYIPFYGIKYAVDTLNMYNDYKREVSQNGVLKSWLDKNAAAYDSQKSQEKDFRNRLEELTMETEKLWKSFGDVGELLQILSCMIASLGDFITAVSKIKTALKSTFFEDVNEAQTAVDKSLAKIQSYHDIFRQKLAELSGRLKKDNYDKIVELIEAT
ncbi:MAG: hypothetical protein K2N80_02120 [Lachnospiraceae bacterium]|nr:hypothetical protein [Lachnospiraceae bacterium]